MNEVAVARRQPYLVVDSPYELARWRPLVNWVLYIPHGIVVYGLQVLSRAVFLVYWVMLIVTGKLQPGLYGVMVMYERYNARAGGFLFGFTETYPPFDFKTETRDDQAWSGELHRLVQFKEPAGTFLRAFLAAVASGQIDVVVHAQGHDGFA